MKKVVILFLIMIPLAFGEIYDGYQDLIVNVDIGSSLYLTSNGGRLDSLKVALKLFPVEDSRQKILNLDVISNPEAKITSGNIYEYVWRELYPKYDYGILSKVHIRNQITQVKSKIGFPFSFNGRFKEYLEESNFIDFNDAIRIKANEIINGEDDYYMVAFKLADWVQNNVKYDLNTLTAKAVQKSSWVLTNKEGVCDELTNLFISMLRTVGIPARFVTGTVYGGGNIGWGNHGWAEVYFPDVGWIPWDVTFGQYGWVDPSHLKLSDSVDSGESSVEYSWRSYNIDVNAGDLGLDTSLDSLGDIFPELVRLTIRPLRETFAFGSYLPIEAVAENLQDFYVATTIILTKGPAVPDNTIAVLLGPRETRSVFWLARVPDNLDKDFIYTSELEVKDSFNARGRNKVFYANTGDSFAENEARELIDSLQGRDEKKLFINADVSCTFIEREYRTDEVINLDCVAINRGTVLLSDVRVCLDTNCSIASLGIGESKHFYYSLIAKESVIFLIENEDLVRKSTYKFNTIKIPEVYLTDILPAKVPYGTNTEVSFDLHSDYKANNVVLRIPSVGQIDIGDLEGKKPVAFEINSKKLVSGLNVAMDYKDENGNLYNLEKRYPIVVENVPFFARTWNYFKNLF